MFNFIVVKPVFDCREDGGVRLSHLALLVILNSINFSTFVFPCKMYSNYREGQFEQKCTKNRSPRTNTRVAL